VVSFDTPAHGRSPGHASNLPEISEAIRTVAQGCGPLHAVIGHSFGVACAIHAVQQGLKVNRFVALSSPRNMRWIAQSCFTAMGISTLVQAVFTGNSKRVSAPTWGNVFLWKFWHANSMCRAWSFTTRTTATSLGRKAPRLRTPGHAHNSSARVDSATVASCATRTSSRALQRLS